MSTHPRDNELHDLVSDALAADAAARIEAHLNECAECRDEVAALRELVASLAGLPPVIRPARDLRPGIWQRIHGAKVDGSAATTQPASKPAPGRSRRFRPTLAAAALALVALTALLSIAIDRALTGRPGPATEAETPLRSAEARFEAATHELEVLIDEQRDLLSPATRELLETSLAAIDGAVDEARTALAADPGNAMLSHMLLAAYEKKLGILRAASQAPVGI